MSQPPQRKADHNASSSSGTAERTAKIQHRLGLHARPAADFVRLANTFTSEIRVRKGRRVVNGKSIMGLLTLAAAAGSRVTVEASGSDAAEAARALAEFLLNGDQEPLAR